MLRQVVGDGTFFEGLGEYRRRHERGNATRADLRAIFEELSGRDLKQFFDQWIETPYRPVLRASWRNLADGRVAVTVKQTQGHSVVHPQPAAQDVSCYRFPLTLRLFSATSVASTAVVDVTQVEETFTLAAPGGAAAVALTVDPDGNLLKIVESVGPAF
jgi:aminopeptidase N